MYLRHCENGVWGIPTKNLTITDFALDNLASIRFGARPDGIYIIFFSSPTVYYQLNVTQSELVLERYIDGQATILWKK